MNTLLKRGAAPLSTVVASLLVSSAMADESHSRRLADHPAVVVQRQHRAAGYDYISKFYAHPAGLYLHAESPSDVEQPAASALAHSEAPIEGKLARQKMALPKPAARIGS